MSFTRANPSGWGFGETLTSAQSNHIDDNQSKAVDGAGGGSYTLAAPLHIAGDVVDIDDLEATAATVDGLTATTLAVGDKVTGNLEVEHDLEIGDNLVVNDNADVFGNLGVTGDLNANAIHAASIALSGAAVVGNGLTVSGITNLGQTGFRFAVQTPTSFDSTISGTCLEVASGSGSHKTTFSPSANSGTFCMLLNLGSSPRGIYDTNGVTLLATMSAATGFALCANMSGTWRVFYST